MCLVWSEISSWTVGAQSVYQRGSLGTWGFEGSHSAPGVTNDHRAQLTAQIYISSCAEPSIVKVLKVKGGSVHHLPTCLKYRETTYQPIDGVTTCHATRQLSTSLRGRWVPPLLARDWISPALQARGWIPAAIAGSRLDGAGHK